MKKVYCRFLEGERIIPLLYPNRGFVSSTNTLFMDTVFEKFTDPVVEVVDRSEDADYLLIPHPYQLVKERQDYLREYEDLSKRFGKKIIAIWYGDSDEKVMLENALVLRTSQYRYKLQPNEVMIPAYSEDLLGGRSLSLRPKQEKATIGFCGWSKPRDLKNRLGTAMKNTFVRLKSVGNPEHLSEMKGITLRANALDHLRATDGIVCNFIERSSYSGHQKTIKMDPVQSRKEFRENIEGSDFVLCVKGDGNFSYRFYETLSLGRIPLMLDTSCCLPLEDRIDYGKFVCKVPLAKLPQIGEYAKEWYAKHSNEEWNAVQTLARKTFEDWLSAPVFLTRYFIEIL